MGCSSPARSAESSRCALAMAPSSARTRRSRRCSAASFAGAGPATPPPAADHEGRPPMSGPIEGMPNDDAVLAAEDSAELQLLVVMSRRAAPDQVEEVLSRLDRIGARGRVAPGRESTVIGAIGDREELASLALEGFAGVQQVLPVQRPYKWVSRETSPEPTTIQVRGRRIGGGPPRFPHRPPPPRGPRATARAPPAVRP